MSCSARIIAALSGAALAISLAVTGCAGQAPDYGQEVADRLQTEVLEVTELSAAADYAAAMVSLDEFEAQLKDALARGELTQERFDSIAAAVQLVRADLQAAIDAQAPAPPPTPSDGDGDGAGDDDEDNSGPDNSGNDGKGKGKGEDKDKGKD